MPQTLEEKSLKQGLKELLDRLPDNCTLEEIEYHVQVFLGVQRALEEIDAGKGGIPQEEVERRVGEWLKSYGTTPP